MDVEIEELAKLLFPDGIPESWKDNEDLSNYITQLSSSGVDKLGREGAHLREERSAILDQTKDLAYTNYKTFIHTADCSKVIYNDFTKVENHLEKLSLSLPNLKSSVNSFLTTSKNLSQSRHLTSLTLTKHTQLLEILELPQLMDTCVRNSYYDEALEIMVYVRRLEKKHPDIPIIASIVTEVQSGTRLMLSQLLSQLRAPLSLPQCLRVVGFLRRLEVFTESELRLKFLLTRDSWMMTVLRGIPREDPYLHITKVVEMSRVHLFDIVTQYRAIFCDDDSRFSLGDPDVNEAAIFQGWILHKVNQFIRIVEKDLERGVGSNLESVLAQCMFFGQSFSRIGADFRNLLTPLFIKAALTQFKKDVRIANLKFDESLSCFSLMETSPITKSSSFILETQDKTRPPLVLMEFTPLAHYLNAIVASFNTLRQCCPIAIIEQVISALTSSLNKVVLALVELHRLESPGFTPKEDSSYERMCHILATAMLPHINQCLWSLFPLCKISQITGHTVAQLQRVNFGQIDVNCIILPIQDFLPVEVDEQISKQEPPTENGDNSLEDNLVKKETVILSPTPNTEPDNFEENLVNVSTNSELTNNQTLNEEKQTLISHPIEEVETIISINNTSDNDQLAEVDLNEDVGQDDSVIVDNTSENSIL